MVLVDLEQFRIDHSSPSCRIEQRSVAFNSSVTDPATGDPKPVWVDTNYCLTHDVIEKPSENVRLQLENLQMVR